MKWQENNLKIRLRHQLKVPVVISKTTGVTKIHQDVSFMVALEEEVHLPGSNVCIESHGNPSDSFYDALACAILGVNRSTLSSFQRVRIGPLTCYLRVFLCGSACPENDNTLHAWIRLLHEHVHTIKQASPEFKGLISYVVECKLITRRLRAQKFECRLWFVCVSS